MNLPLDLNLPSMQEMLDTVFDHFITKNNPPSYIIRVDGSVSCLYRGPNGAKCAFGLFIPNELYIPEMEGCDPRSIVKMHEKRFGHFCQQLQNCHDRAVLNEAPAFKKHMQDNLNRLAELHHLIPPQ